MAQSNDSTHCPACDAPGRKVGTQTLKAFLNARANERVGDSATYRFCRTSQCEVVYFDQEPGTTFLQTDVRLPVFQKSSNPERLVCYCFRHSVAEIAGDVAQSGASPALADITEKCRQGLDRCETENPQGSCCLGNVRKVIKDASPSLSVAKLTELDGAGDTVGDADCCAETPAHAVSAAVTTSTEAKVGLWSAGGALVAAVLASACCWLPLLLIGVGASAAGVAGFFEAYRLVFLGATAVPLGAGFYWIYFRKPKCEPGSACEVPNVRVRTMNKVSLWIATVFVVAFAAFPNYVGALYGAGDDTASAAPAVTGVAQSRVLTYAVEGMTCESCAAHVEGAATAVPGVVSANVRYEAREVDVVVTPNIQLDALDSALDDTGYPAELKLEMEPK